MKIPDNHTTGTSSNMSRQSRSRSSGSFSVSPSEPEWTRYKDVIAKLYESMTLSEVMTKMSECYSFHATKRQYTKHFTDWDVRQNLSSEEREALYKQLLDDHVNSRDSNYLTFDKVRKLLRHCREASDPPSETIIGILRRLEKSYLSLQNHQNPRQGLGSLGLLALEAPNTDEVGIVDHSRSSAPSHTTSSNCAFETNLGLSEPESWVNWTSSWFEQQQSSNFTAESIPRYTFGAGEADDAMELLVWSSSRYYNARIQRYLAETLSGTNLPDGQALNQHALSRAKAFGTRLKSGIYYLKERDEELAQPLLEEAKAQIPQLCELEPLTMLRELFATLSLVNTSIKPAVRAEMLEIFAQSTFGEFDDSFGSICRQLRGPWITDEALVNALICVSNVTMTWLPAEHLEVYELRRTLIRLLRRRASFDLAQQFARGMIADAERHWGRISETTRLARTELVYILNDLGQHTRALQIAEDIVYGARQDEGSLYPSKRAVYAMEDVAEICGKLGRKRDAGMWLGRALTGARKNGGDEQCAAHISRKLQALCESR